jgi:hypothetical protein
MRAESIALLAILAMGSASSELAVPRRAAARLRSDFARAEKVELLRLQPTELPEAGPPPKSSVTFHDQPILRSVVLSSEQAARAGKQVTDSIARNPVLMTACFYPRHGIRLTRGAQHVDLVICFECETVHVYRGGAMERLNIDEAPRAALDAFLAL